MKISELKECGYYAEFFEILRPDIPSHYKIPNDAIVNYYKTHPKVFKEGDGSHPDMSIEECNDIKRLLFSHPNGYNVGRSVCTESWSKFCYSMGYFGTYTKTATIVTNPIPYKVWLNYLGVEPKEKGSGDDYPLTKFAIENASIQLGRENLKTEMKEWEKEISTKIITESPLISAHQKAMIEQYNPNPNRLSGGFEINAVWVEEASKVDIIEFSKIIERSRQSYLISEIKKTLTHIPDNQHAGFSKQLIELCKQL